ncbi:hypothetical protein [Haloplasma contractile]|uniref:Uncharacterized protein n=1 Tax=Haloplasma contractile SSD-17B TaxID=1033810 RepID=U2DZX0_9MOLU|nr:hypothetical protein [Haloplasma contractile]ERJ13732.1 hypothetical protein HLPCO_000398 [Haloplasma contractile SSD-17B]
MRNNNDRPKLNRKSDLEQESRQYNQEFARANATIRNQNPYDQEFAVETEGTLRNTRNANTRDQDAETESMIRNTRNANTRGRRQDDALNLEFAKDNDFKNLKRDKDNVEFAKDNDFKKLDKKDNVEFAKDNDFKKLDKKDNVEFANDNNFEDCDDCDDCKEDDCDCE